MSVRSFEMRLRRVEQRRQLDSSAAELYRERFVVLVDFADANLKPVGNVVLDLFRNSGSVCWARERVGEHPGDAGLRCEPGRHLPDVLAEVHASCPWNKNPGVCRLCDGTPIAARPKTAALETEESA